jgi:two-component system OmpR family sensor kinase
MGSLRARVLASVLALAAIGLIVLGAVTYAEQSSFLEGRLNQEVEGATPALSQILDKAGFMPPNSRPKPNDEPLGARSQGTSTRGSLTTSQRSAGPGPNLPPGTYGQRREASGKILGSEQITYGQTPPPAPKLPAHVPIGKLFTVGSVGSSGLRYRAYVTRDPDDSGLTLAAVPLSEVDATLSRLLLVEALVIVGVLLALGASAFFVVRLGLRPLTRMELTAGQIAAGELSRRVSPATPKTEVGRLGLALNEMLDRLEQAFARREASEDRLRQFLADASHELRTPLASIRGYAELFRMGATQEQGATETAMRRIEAESKRMGVLVEDLLTLARLDESPQLTRATVDLATLARNAVDDARATVPDRQITASAPDAAPISGDAHQLRQVFANLMRNALVHTPAGTPIEVAVEQDHDSVTFSVRDHGPGLPATASGDLFERFWRAEGGRERGRAGAGLGLAIVREVIAAHHGRISAEDASDGGARFTVWLPKTTSTGPSASSEDRRP